jgi:hypothetical protein
LSKIPNFDCLDITAIFGPESASHSALEGQKEVTEESHSLEVVLHHKVTLTILIFCVLKAPT